MKPLGYAPAQTMLGYMYFTGIGMPKDSTQAVSWYCKAAEQGYSRAQADLEIMHVYGLPGPEQCPSVGAR